MRGAPERATRREIERRLVETPAGEPPAELARRLLAEVPDRLEVAPRTTAGATGLRRPPRWLAAAAVATVVVGGAWTLWRLGGEAVPAAREAWVAGESGEAAGVDGDGSVAGVVASEGAGAEAAGAESPLRPDGEGRAVDRARRPAGEQIDEVGAWLGREARASGAGESRPGAGDEGAAGPSRDRGGDREMADAALADRRAGAVRGAAVETQAGATAPVAEEERVDSTPRQS